MIYLASPYSSTSNLTMETRYRQALEATAVFMREGHAVYSPIVHCHPMACIYALPRDISFWEDYSYHMIDLADEVWVLELEGLESSIGVMKEIEYAKAHDKPIRYVAPVSFHG